MTIGAAPQRYHSKIQFTNSVAHFAFPTSLCGNIVKLTRIIRHSPVVEQTNGEENVDFAQSLVHLNKALQLDSGNVEALFNRALLYREMDLLPQSEKDWRLYLEQDSSSKWAEEARDKLRSIEEHRIKLSSGTH